MDRYDHGLNEYRKLRLYKGSLEYDDLDKRMQSTYSKQFYDSKKIYEKACMFTVENKDKYDGCFMPLKCVGKAEISHAPRWMHIAFGFKVFNATYARMNIFDTVVEFKKDKECFVLPDCDENNPVLHYTPHQAIKFETDGDAMEYVSVHVTYPTLQRVVREETSFRLLSEKIMIYNWNIYDLQEINFDSTVQGIVRLLAFFNSGHDHIVLDMTRSEYFSYEELDSMISYLVH